MAHNLCILCVILTVLAKPLAADRKLNITYNEQCNITACQDHPDVDSFNLVHVTAVGTNDTLHFLWSSIGAPAMLLARTSNMAELKIDWGKLVADTQFGAITFTPDDEVYHASSLVFSRLIEFNDTDDLATLYSDSTTKTTNLDSLEWQSATIDETQFSAVFSSSMGLLGHGTVALHFTAFDKDGRLSNLPHLLHTENSTQFDLTMQNLPSHFVHSRFAVQTMVTESGETNDKFNLNSQTSIDDEYTPATFTTFELKLPDSPLGSFSQWKPVSYTKTQRTMEYSSHVKVYELEKTAGRDNMPSTSIAHAYFSPHMMTNQTAFLNISFGETQDGFYKATNYSSWSATMGYGEPPEESMSVTVYIVIATSLGLPLLIMVVGGAGVCVFKYKQKKKYLILEN